MYKKSFLVTISVFIFSQCFSQGKSESGNLVKPEIFTSGFIDIINNGQINSSARIIRLFIGEEGKFLVPLSIYGGISNNNFKNQSPGSIMSNNNNHLVTQFINPFSGLVNVCLEGIQYVKFLGKRTKFGISYHFGERVLTGIKVGEISNPQTGKPINFLNSYGATGCYFQTGAIERSNIKKLGVFWVAVRYHVCYNNPRQSKLLFSQIPTNGIYAGYSMGFGVEINEVVNLKMICYKYAKQNSYDFLQPIYQFSFNYVFEKK